jgi:hypothetical protein
MRFYLLQESAPWLGATPRRRVLAAEASVDQLAGIDLKLEDLDKKRLISRKAENDLLMFK